MLSNATFTDADRAAIRASHPRPLIEVLANWPEPTDWVEPPPSLNGAPTLFEPHVETIVVFASKPQTVHIQDPEEAVLRSLCGRDFERSLVRYAIGSLSEVYCKTCHKIRSTR